MSDLWLLGVGLAARAVARRAREADPTRPLAGTTRRRERATELASLGLRAVLVERGEPPAVPAGADVVVSFPPDGSTDSAWARACAGARSIVYVSSTAVYGARRGVVDDETPTDASPPRAQQRLAAEQAWRDVGACVLRAPGLYDDEAGLFARLRDGAYRLPGDGSGVVSRLHTDDLAAFALAACDPRHSRRTFVVGDLAPAPHAEVTRWLCDQASLPLPPSVPLAEAPETLRGSRSIDPRAALDALGVTLRYPTYRDGFARAIERHNLRRLREA